MRPEAKWISSGMDTRARMIDQLNRRRAGFSLPQPFYTDPDFLRLDRETIFHRSWLFAGHDCEIPARGHYFTMQIGDYPIIVLRSDDGEVLAFHNTCRHRGSRVCTAAKGRAARLVCPYHQWSYGLDGRLIRGRHMGEGFDPSPYRLGRVHARSVGGFIFVCVADEAPDFEPFHTLVEPYLAPHRLGEAKVAHEETIVERGNWKLVWENNRECYHCTANHPELCRTFPEAAAIVGAGRAAQHPAIAALWDRCERAGLPFRFEISADGGHRVVRMPLVGEAVSYTMTGAAAVGRSLAEIGEGQIGTLMLYHYPSVWSHILADHAVTFRVLPLGPLETELTTRWLVHKDAVEGVDYSIEDLTRVWRATNDQDRRIVEENQRGIGSPAYQPGPYAPDDEAGVAEFVDWYCATMRQALEPAVGLREVA